MALRTQPADFVVTEQLGAHFAATLGAQWTPVARHAVFTLSKNGLTTPDAIGWLAKAAGVKQGTIDYAGLKDKHAQTIQHISVPVTAPIAPANATLAGEQWSAVHIGYSPEPILADAIDGNHFTIVARALSKGASDEMTRRARRLTAESGELVFTNYFGNQRFGSNRHQQGWAARALIDGDFATALRLLIATPSRKDAGKTRLFTRQSAEKWGDWSALAASLPKCPEKHAIDALAAGATAQQAFEKLPAFTQQMAVEAFQSIIWNSTARLLVAPIQNIIKTDDDFGPMFFAPVRALHLPAHIHLLSLQLPMLAASSSLAEPWMSAATQAMAEHAVTLSQLTIPGLRRPNFGEALRPLIGRVADFTISPPEPDDLAPGSAKLKRTVTFTLGRGSYATVVLRALGQ